MREIGILGGTFDPLHCGHLAIGTAAMTECGLDEILLIPARVQPFKVGRPMAEAQDRVNMARLATAEDPRFRVSTVEAFGQAVSYTYHTLCRLRQDYSGDVLHFILGTDAVLHLEEWHQSEKLMREASFIVAMRPGDPDADVRETIDRLRRQYGARIHILHNQPVRISSTEIKARVRAGQDLDGWVPAPVERYIIEHGLYQTVY